MSGSEKRLTVKVLAVFAVILVIAAVTGCATLQSQFEQPTVRLANVVFLDGGLLQQRYGVTLEVDNPNGFKLPIKGINYAVKLAGRDFASGLTPNPFSIPARGSDQVQFEVRTNLLDSIAHLSRLLSEDTETLAYELTGNIEIDLPLVGAVPFSQSGSVPLRSSKSQAL